MLWTVLKLYHTIPHLKYESVLAGDDIVNMAVVIKDLRTKERVLAALEFNLRSPSISIKVQLDPASLSSAHTIFDSIMASCLVFFSLFIFVCLDLFYRCQMFMK